MRVERRQDGARIRMPVIAAHIRRQYRADRYAPYVPRDSERAIQKPIIQKPGFLKKSLSQNWLPSPRLQGEGPGVRGFGIGSKNTIQKPGFLKKPGFWQPGFLKRPNISAAFTLVELLVTITIMSIIAATVLFASAQATQSARRSATRTKINAINSLLMERWNEYATRRVPLKFSGPLLQNPDFSQTASLRLNAIRYLMMMEMPDRWNEVVFDTVGNKPPSTPINGFLQGITMPDGEFLRRTALSNSYLMHYRNLKTTDPNTIQRYEGAECLYMIVMYGTADGEARSLFRESDIGDVDNDGAPEFLDGWGRPIGFLRWPAGFPSEIQPYLYTSNNNVFIEPPNAMADDHDPFDVYHVDPIPMITNTTPYNGPPRAFRLLPLIYSAGPDGDTDLNVAQVINLSSGLIDPYAWDKDNRFSGQPFDSENDGEGWHDNIHNHLKDVQ